MPQKMEGQSCCPLHNNAPAHQSVLVKDFLAKNNVTTLKHPPYSPDMAPADFTCSLACSQHWRESVFAMLWHRSECIRRAARLFWMKCSLNDYTVLHFSEIKWFQEHFEAITYRYGRYQVFIVVSQQPSSGA